MLAFIAEKLKWFVDEYLQENSCIMDGTEVRLLDIGRYESGPERSNIFLRKGIAYHCIEPFHFVGTEAVPENMHDWKDQFADNSFDVVVATHALEHSKFPWVTLQEVRRVLKPGGIFFAIEPGCAEKETISFTKHRFLPDYFRFSDDGLKSLAEYAGMSVIYASSDTPPKNLLTPSVMAETVLIAGKGKRDWKTVENYNVNRLTIPQAKRKFKIACLGNCVIHNAYLYLQLAMPDADIKFISCVPPKITDDADKQTVPKHLTDQIGEYDILLVHNHPVLRAFKKLGKKVLVFPSFQFRYFYPDFLQGFFADTILPISSIALECHRRGYSLDKTTSLFTHDSYLRLGYFDAFWDDDMNHARHQFSNCGLDLGNFLPSWTKKGVFMVDPFHPIDLVIKDVVDGLFKKAGIEISPCIYSGMSYFDRQVQYRRPVFPEIADYYGLSNVGSYNFRVTYPYHPPWKFNKTISLHEFISYSFAEYTRDPENFMNYDRLDAL